MDDRSSNTAVATPAIATVAQGFDIATIFSAGVFSAGSFICDPVDEISGSICELIKIKVDLCQLF